MELTVYLFWRAMVPQRAMSQDTAALDQEITRLENANRWPEAINALWRRVGLHQDPREKVRTLEHLVSVYRVKLRNEAEALRATEALVAIDPTHEGAVASLRQLYTQRRDTARLQALEARVAQAKPAGFFGNFGSMVSGALGSAGVAASTAAAGVFTAVTSAPVAYEQPTEARKGPDPMANKCPSCRADKVPGASACGACGAPF
jgi:hypothetical protein